MAKVNTTETPKEEALVKQNTQLGEAIQRLDGVVNEKNQKIKELEEEIGKLNSVLKDKPKTGGAASEFISKKEAYLSLIQGFAAAGIFDQNRMLNKGGKQEEERLVAHINGLAQVFSKSFK